MEARKAQAGRHGQPRSCGYFPSHFTDTEQVESKPLKQYTGEKCMTCPHLFRVVISGVESRMGVIV